MKRSYFPLFLCLLFSKSKILLACIAVKNNNYNGEKFRQSWIEIKKFDKKHHHHVIEEKVGHHQNKVSK